MSKYGPMSRVSLGEPQAHSVAPTAALLNNGPVAGKTAPAKTTSIMPVMPTISM